MSSIIFMAVQCCECSTMQVKQRKKNSKSNKWACVVCNQKQSIRKVFAESSMAKNLRPFVQSFNMSRGQLSQPLPPMADDPLSLPHSKRPRSDWTEFLDPDHIDQVSESRGVFDIGPEIVTEMPVKMRSRYKINGSKRALLLKGNTNGYNQVENEKGNHCEEEEEERDSKWSHYLSNEDYRGIARESSVTVDEWKSLANEEKVEDEEVHPDFL